MGKTGSEILCTVCILITVLFTGGCDKDVAWTDTVSIPEQGWTPESPLTFELDLKAYEPEENRFVRMTAQAVGDTVPRLRGDFSASVSLRYRDDCNARSLRVVMESASLDREITTDTLTFRLFSPEGESVGQGRFGLNETTLRLPAPLTVSEGTVITFTPLDYSTPVTDLLSLTLTLRH